MELYACLGVYDKCQMCDGKEIAADVCGICFGSNQVDKCGICNTTNSTNSSQYCPGTVNKEILFDLSPLQLRPHMEITSIVSLGDLNNDNSPDFALGIPYYSDTSGAIFVIFTQEGEIIDFKLFTSGSLLANNYELLSLGFSMTTLGDLNGDYVVDIAVSAPDANHGVGKVYIMFLSTDGNIFQMMELTQSSSGSRFGMLLSSGIIDGQNMAVITAVVC